MSINRAVLAAFAAALIAAHQHRNAQPIVGAAAGSMKQIESNRGLDKLVRRAKAVFIVPIFYKGAVVVGGEGGAGVLLARKNRKWKVGAQGGSVGPQAGGEVGFRAHRQHVRIGSVGQQAGGEVGPMVMMPTTKKAVSAFSGSGNFSLNAVAGLTIANFPVKGQANVGKADVVVRSGAAGGFLPASAAPASVPISGSAGRITASASGCGRSLPGM